MASSASGGPDSPRQALSSFVQRTGMHAVPSIASDRSRPSRIGWTVLLLIAASFLLYQIISICEKVRSYPTSTVTSVKYESPMKFPAVTFCNLNPLRMERVVKMKNADVRRRRSPQGRGRGPTEKQGKALRGQKEKIPKRVTTKNGKEPKQGKQKKQEAKKEKKKRKQEKKGQRRRKKKKKKSQKETISEIAGLVEFPRTDTNKRPGNFSRKKLNTTKLRDDTVKKDRVMYLMNTLPEETVRLLTYDLMDIVVDCSFQGRNCDFDRDFVRVMNPRLGACFIFNSGMNDSEARAPVKEIFNSGTDNGLELTLFVDVKNYLPDVAPVAGYKLLLHDQSTPPIPDQDGFVLKPGAFTMLGLRASEIERAIQPYGNCRHFTEADNKSMNMYLDSLPLTSPTMTTCMRTCEQLEILSNCDCFSLQHGYSSAPAFDAYNSSRDNPCSLDDESFEYTCTREQLALVNKKDSFCKTKMCSNHECFSRHFSVSQSIASWPTRNSFANIQDTFKSVDVDISTYKQLVADATPKAKENFGKNFLKVMVYFEDLNVINIKTLPSYTWIDFLSDLGGQGGLWLGMSAFTIIEVCVLLIEMCRLSVFCCLKRKPGRHNEPPETPAEEIPLEEQKADDEVKA